MAVPLPLFTNVTPLGSAPLSVSVGGVKPVVVTVNVPGVPTVKVVLLGLVMAGKDGRSGCSLDYERIGHSSALHAADRD